MKLSEIRNILREEDIQLTKSLGQNFLHDQHQLQKIVALAQIKPDDKILEIGPGLGPLTEPLLQSAGHVTAIEKDHRLIELLKKKFAKCSNITLKHADALQLIRKAKYDMRTSRELATQYRKGTLTWNPDLILADSCSEIRCFKRDLWDC